MDTDYNIKGLDYVKAGRLLPQVHDTPSRVEKFLVNDSAKLFSDNLQKQDASWKYRTKEVTYVLNNQSYRAPEWNTIEELEPVACLLQCIILFYLIKISLPHGQLLICGQIHFACMNSTNHVSNIILRIASGLTRITHLGLTRINHFKESGASQK